MFQDPFKQSMSPHRQQVLKKKVVCRSSSGTPHVKSPARDKVKALSVVSHAPVVAVSSPSRRHVMAQMNMRVVIVNMELGICAPVSVVHFK